MDASMITDLEEARRLIDTANLEPIMQRLIREKKWMKAQAMAACQQYRNFLFLHKKYGDHYTLPPSTDIDEVWHAHILHTQDYYDFCQQVFGKFLHHNPGISDDAQQFAQLFEEHTQKFYYEEFKDYIYAINSGLVIKLINFFRRTGGLFARLFRYEKLPAQ